jgi:hypothetical protein
MQPGDDSSKKLVSSRGIVFMGYGVGVACMLCARDLDENGLFPEERAQAGWANGL